MLTRTFLAAALLAAGVAQAAEPPPPGGIPDIVGPRALGLSAALGATVGNEGLYVNPGAVVARRRYSVEVGGLIDRRGAETVDQFLGGSIVDTISNDRYGMGISFLRANRGLFTGNVFHGAIGGNLAEGMSVGLGGKYFSVDGPKKTSGATADAGLHWQVSDLVTLGAAGYNLVSVKNDAVGPMGAGAGLALGNDRSFQITADWKGDFDRRAKTANRWAAGAEALVLNFIPLRAGWMKDEVLDTTWWSAGGGLVTPAGVSLDVGYRQSVKDPKARTIAASLKLFFLQ